MPGGTARLRVRGAITRRLGSVIGPSLKGSKSLVGELMLFFPGEMEDMREQLCIAASGAIAGGIRAAQTSRAGCDFRRILSDLRMARNKRTANDASPRFSSSFPGRANARTRNLAPQFRDSGADAALRADPLASPRNDGKC